MQNNSMRRLRVNHNCRQSSRSNLPRFCFSLFLLDSHRRISVAAFLATIGSTSNSFATHSIITWMPKHGPHYDIESPATTPLLSTHDNPLSSRLINGLGFPIQPNTHGDSNCKETRRAGIVSSLINLLNTILGSGMLAMPAAIASLGLLPGLCVISICAFLSASGLYFLSKSAEALEGTEPASFTSISRITYPKLAVTFEVALAIKCFGVAISYLVIIGDLMPQGLFLHFNMAEVV